MGKALATALPCCRTLTKLWMNKCQLDGEDVAMICESAAKCPKLSNLCMGANPKIGPEGVVKIAATCQDISTLTYLNLRKANLGAVGAAGIVEMIARSSKSFSCLNLMG